MIPAGPWQPDLVGHNSPALKRANNCYRVADGYAALPLESTMVWSPSGNFNSCVHERIWHYGDEAYYSHNFAITSGGAPQFWWGSGYQFQKTSGINSLSRFVHLVPVVWGDYLLVFGSLDVPQKILSEDTNDAGVTKTTDIGGTPPAAKFAAVVRQQLFLGYTYESATYYPKRVWWSALGDFEGWTSGTNLAGFQDLQVGGAVTGIVGGEFGLIFQEKAITRVDFIGAPDVWQFDTIEHKIGCVAPKSIVQVGTDVYFYSDAGFRVVREGSTIELIGRVVDRWFKYTTESLASPDTHRDTRERMWGHYDEVSGLIFWTFPDDGGYANRMIIFNTNLPPDEAWSTMTPTAEPHSLFQIESQGASPNKDTDFGLGIITGCEGSAIGNYRIYSTDVQNSKAATFETGTVFDENGRTYLRGFRAFITDSPFGSGNGSYQLTIRHSENDSSAAYTEESQLNENAHGKIDCDIESRFFQFIIDIDDAQWLKFSGYWVDKQPAGEY